MTTLQDTYRNMAKQALARHDSFGYGYWAKRLKEAQAIAKGGALC